MEATNRTETEEVVMKWANGAAELLKDPNASEEAVTGLITAMTDAITALTAAHRAYMPILSEKDADVETEAFESITSTAEGVVEALQELKDTFRPPPKPAKKTDEFLRSLSTNIRAEAARRKAILKQQQEKNLSQSQGNPDGSASSTSLEDSLAPEHQAEGMAELKGLFGLLTAPKVEMEKYDGDPLKYYFFTKAFKENVEDIMPESSCLTRLIQSCTGDAKRVIESCIAISNGYQRAKEILKSRFGDPYVISQAWIAKITSYDNLRANDGKALQSLADNLRNCEQTLEAMNCLAEMNSQGNLVKVVAKLPQYLQNRWRKEVKDLKRRHCMPNLRNLVVFVDDASEEANDPVYGLKTLSSTSSTSTQHPKSGDRNSSRPNQRSSYSAEAKPTRKCPICDGAHRIYTCESFRSMGPEDRLSTVRKLQLCFNCLGVKHNAHTCKSTGVCQVNNCGMRHNSLMHRFKNSSGSGSGDAGSGDAAPGSNAHESSAYYVGGNRLATLPVVSLSVKRVGGSRSVKVHALLDSGSNATFCSPKLWEQLGIRGKADTISLSTLGGHDSIETEVTSLLVMGDHGEKTIKLPIVFKRNVCVSKENVRAWEYAKAWPHLQGIEVPCVSADEVMLLIGQDVPEALRPLDVVGGRGDEPYAVRTALGWTLNGPVAKRGKKAVESYFVDADLERFWKLEGGIYDERQHLSPDDQSVLKLWEEEGRFQDGSYEFPIPFKQKNPVFPPNLGLAEARLNSLKKKLERDEDLKRKYSEVMEELLNKGYAEKVPQEEIERPDGKVWYLPHHHVPKAVPGAVRVVFDCAAKCNGVSLNSMVLQGPDLTNRLIGVLLRFREGKVAFMADIRAMFYQVKVSPDDCDVMRFLWFEADGNVAVHRMCVHLFGGTWSPSVCSHALQKLTEDFGGRYSQDAREAVCRNFYVDDLLKSVDSEEEARRLAAEVKDLVAEGGFELAKWTFSTDDEMKDLDVQGCKALGIFWNVKDDVLTYKTDVDQKPFTKRGLLSMLSGIFDPMGFAAPYILRGKKLVQELHRQGLDWDEAIPDNLKQQWMAWWSELESICRFSVPRALYRNIVGKVVCRQLHHFSDASQGGYGVVSYLRVVNDKGDIEVTLVMAKGKLAPLKTVTIPRLELTAAALAVKQEVLLRGELDMELQSSKFWTDSTIVLGYISNREKRLHTYVANRVTAINEHSDPDQWGHVDGKSNPADLVSRGVEVEVLKGDLWLKGPQFLWEPQDQWRCQPDMPALDEHDPEVKKSSFAADVEQESILRKLTRRFSTWMSLKRAVAWILVMRGVLSKISKPVARLEAGHLLYAEKEIIKMVQKEVLSKEIDLVKRGEPCPKHLEPLKPILVEGILRVGGRLANAQMPWEAKHPVILPGNHEVVQMILESMHRKTGHAGREYLLSIVGLKYWVLGARKAIRVLLNRCILCKRRDAVACQQLMADLPVDRVTPGKSAFESTGVDYFGTFYVKRGRGREKRWGCLFTCLATRAIHLEVAVSLEADSFINCLTRFIARRGEPQTIRSDNGTNFVGTENELGKVHGFLAEKGITWTFNPPGASHMGGVWERQIRSVRKVLRGLMEEQLLTDDTLYTLLCQVEAILNNRPMTAVSTDPHDLTALTPNHLLILRAGGCLTGQFDFVTRVRWKQVQHLANVFWRRWTHEYLPLLQKRTKWMTKTRNLRVGDLVLVIDYQIPRNEWCLGRILEIFEGRDGLVRSAGVQTKKGRQVRPISKLVLLEGD